MRVYGFNGYGGPEQQGWFDIPEPRATTGTVLIEVRSVGINYRDVRERNGERGERQLPHPFGVEAAGIVIDDPSGTYTPGSRVFGSPEDNRGALGRYTLLALSATAAIPEGVSDDEAAVIPVAPTTGLNALDDLPLSAGDSVLVLGAGGGVGVHTIQLARNRGLRVIGVAREHYRELIEGFGVEFCETNGEWTAHLRDQLGGSAKALVDGAGGSLLREATPLIADPGNMRSAADWPLVEELGGTTIPWTQSTENYEAIAAMVAAGELEIVIGRTFEFEDAPAAIDAVENGHFAGRVVVHVSAA